MKKVLLAVSLSSAFSLAFAGEMDKVNKTFDELDADNNSYLNAAEIDGTPLSDKFSSVDGNDNDLVTEAEFEQAMTDYPDLFANSVFDKMEADLTMDGLGEPMETTTYTENMVEIEDIDATTVNPKKMVMDEPGTKSGLVAEAKFQLLDLDSDKTLTKSEAMSGEDELQFNKIDSDNNQKISKQEFVDYMEEMADE